MVRIAGAVGVLFASIYWIANHFYIKEIQLIIDQFFYFWAALLAIVLTMYLLLIRALLRHIRIMSHGYDAHEGKNPKSQVDYTNQYWSAIFEGAIVSLIIVTTITGVSLSGIRYFLHYFHVLS